ALLCLCQGGGEFVLCWRQSLACQFSPPTPDGYLCPGALHLDDEAQGQCFEVCWCTRTWLLHSHPSYAWIAWCAAPASRTGANGRHKKTPTSSDWGSQHSADTSPRRRRRRGASLTAPLPLERFHPSVRKSGRCPGSRRHPTLCAFPRPAASVVSADFVPLTVAGQR